MARDAWEDAEASARMVGIVIIGGCALAAIAFLIAVPFVIRALG